MNTRRPWAWPLVPLYAAGIEIKDRLRAAGILKTQRLGWPVISVGSLSAGGAGKTPVVIALVDLLRAQGWEVDVLSRGYGRGSAVVERVRTDGESPALRYGDEPVLIAQRTGAPVWVGGERYEAGRMAESARSGGDVMRGVASAAGIRAHLLDDGFQHRQLARAVDVVLVTEEDIEDALLPAGNMREPLSALGRAGVVVVREEERERVLLRIRKELREETAIWTVRRQISFAASFAQVGTQRHVAFCAIARPMDLLRDLREANIGVIDAVTFPDHHGYTMADMEKLIARCGDCDGNAFVTTEKDAVKLSQAMRARLEAHGPVAVARLEVRFMDEPNVVSDLEARLK